MSTIRAIGLLSGGLDSTLAARLLLDQGIEVIGFHLESPTACRSGIREVARELGIELVVRSKGAEYLRLLRHPRWGYGRNMNPCIDCRIFMFTLGKPLLEEFEAGFLFTGEVVGQRPMSQSRSSLDLIDRHAGLEGWILRPLSARLLPETEPELRGWVDRARLLDLSGRQRVEQLALAGRYGLRGHDAPAGGCLLTDPYFSEKLRDLFAHTPEETTTLADVALLRIGRHVRLGPGVKIVLGRDQAENLQLADFAGDDRRLVEPVGFSGPSALVCGRAGPEALRSAARLIVDRSRGVAPDSVLRWQGGGESGEIRLAELIGAVDARLPATADSAAGLPGPTGATEARSRSAPQPI